MYVFILAVGYYKNGNKTNTAVKDGQLLLPGG